GMEHDLRATSGGPADGFRVAPPLVTNDHTERHRAALEETPSIPGHIRALLRWVDLHLVLEPCDRSVAVDHERRDDERSAHKAIGAKDDGDLRLRGYVCDRRPCTFEESWIRRRPMPRGCPVAWHVALGKAHELGATGSRGRDSPFYGRNR